MGKKYSHYFYRTLFYIVGLAVLAFGLILNMKAGLGASPINSISLSTSAITGYSLGDMVLALYLCFIAVQMLLHIAGKVQHPRSVLLQDALQFPLSIIFTRCMNLFAAYVPDFQSAYPEHFLGSIPWRLIVLLGSVICTGIGAAMALDMRVIPNPGEGIVQALADCTGRSVGLMKNVFDFLCILINLFIGLVFAGQVYGIGIGTIVSMIGVGRTIAFFNHFALSKMQALSGLT